MKGLSGRELTVFFGDGEGERHVDGGAGDDIKFSTRDIGSVFWVLQSGS